jgi:hypothetical protein
MGQPKNKLKPAGIFCREEDRPANVPPGTQVVILKPYPPGIAPFITEAPRDPGKAIQFAPGPEIVDRAIHEIDPSQDKMEECRYKTVSAIEYLHRSQNSEMWHAIANKEQRRSLELINSGINKILMALDSLPSQWRQALLVNEPFDIPKIGSDGLYWPDAAERLSKLVEILKAASSRSEIYTNLKVSDIDRIFPGSLVPKADRMKRTAACYAYGLLDKFGKKPPSLGSDGAFYNLASILYEGAVGNAGVSFERQCRAVHRLRQRLDKTTR